MLSFHRCFIPTVDLSDDTYLNNLQLRPVQKDTLQGARKLAREALRAAFIRETVAFFGEERPIAPAFFTQGSWSYKTINRPTHVPPQQTDMDDGCFLPMSFVRGATPRRAANWFYNVADQALKKLVEAQGWKAYDAEKETCCRIIIDDENHLDVPLYAIRDDQFVSMKKMAMDRAWKFKEAAINATTEDDYVFDWSMVTQEDVLLARRNGLWRPSNPMDVYRWAESAVAQNGEQLRRVWREIKGWRDQQFREGGGPSSIALMVMVEADFDEIAGRDDLTLQAAAKSIQHRSLGRIDAPWDKREDLNRLTSEERKALAVMAKELEEDIDYCIRGTKANAALYLKRLGARLGRHFSKEESRVQEVSEREVIHAYPAASVVAPPFRGNSRSA